MARTTTDTSAGKSITADCVSVLLMALGNTSISKAQYDMMSAIDGNRTSSSFEHQFRSITQKAKELKARVEGGEKFVAVAPGQGGKGKRKADSMSATNSDAPATPPKTPKKPKTTPKPRAPAKKATATDTKNDDSASPSSSDVPGRDGDSAFDEAFETFIKPEHEWDEEGI